MNPLSVSNGILPIGEFKSNAARILRELQEQESPKIITQNGRPAAVLLSPHVYDALVARQEFDAANDQALRDIEAGDVVENSRVSEWLKSWGSDNELGFPRPAVR